MPDQIEQLATQFEALNAEVVSIVENCSDEQWKQPSVAENWPVAVVAHHIGVVNSGFAGMVEKFVAGDTYTPNTSMDEIHAMNAEHAREYANVGRPEVLDKVRTGGEAVAAALRNLSADDLDHPAGVYGGNPLTVRQVIDYVVIGHTAEHLNSIRATVGA